MLYIPFCFSALSDTFSLLYYIVFRAESQPNFQTVYICNRFVTASCEKLHKAFRIAFILHSSAKKGMFHVEHSFKIKVDCASFLRICADIEQVYQRLSEVQSDIYPHPQADRIFRLQPSSQALQRLHETAPVHGHTVGLS